MKDALGAVQSILLLGGSSDIGVAITERLVRPRGARVVLAGRRPEAMRAAAARLSQAGARRIDLVEFDATATASHRTYVEQAAGKLGDIDIAILAFGLLGDQRVDEEGGEGAVEVALTNYVGVVSTGLALARLLRRQGHGTLVVVSSVAGERVRRSNFIYGSSKAGADGFAQGLADSLAGSGARILLVRPGFVRDKMTANSGRRPPLSTTPAAVADATVRALASGTELIWVPASMRPVMAVARHLPRPLFRRLPF